VTAVDQKAILGIWDGHDSGAACLTDGRVVSAVNEERLTRRKLEVAFPEQAIRMCLAQAGLTTRDVAIVAASTTDPAKALERLAPWSKEQYYRVRRRQVHPGPMAALTQRIKRRLTTWSPSAWSRALSRSLLSRRLAPLGLGDAQLTLFDHHHCHAIAAAHASGFDECAVVTIDGLGDGLSSTVSRFASGRLQVLASSSARDSLGVFFEHVTELLNMRELEDEGKVMALADHASPVDDAENPLLRFLTTDRGRIVFSLPPGRLVRELRRIHWSSPNERFARLAQRTVEVVVVKLVTDALSLTGCRKVALAGGVASNVKANRCIRHIDGLEDLYVFPHMGDGGLPLGAAVAAYVAQGGNGRVLVNPRELGPSYPVEAMQGALSGSSLSICTPPDPVAEVASRLAAGQIVCWFQGGMEYGPRALGQRSVLARPDSLAIKDRLNLVLKRRVWYQPFCPSVLEDDALRLFADWHIGGHACRDMTMTYMVEPAFRDRMIGVINVDGSCRPQIVATGSDTPFARLLIAFRALTGLGALLNTSFNIHGEPLVCTPVEAVDVFQRGGADALAMGPFVATPARDGRGQP
jgi:carbamoyltransferase